MGVIQKQGIRNAVITYSGVLVGFISLMFVQPNLLLPEELGLTRIIVASASLIATLIPFGATSITVKFFPYFRNEAKKNHGYFGLMLLFPLFGAALCGVLVYVFKDAIIAQYAEQSELFTRYFYLLFPFAIVIGLNMVLASYTAAIFKTTVVTFFESVVVRVLFILLIVIYYFEWVDLSQFINLFAVIYLLQSISIIIYIYNIDALSLRIDLKHLKSIGVLKMLKYGLLLTLTSFSSISLKHLDTLMIGKYLNLENVGVFAVAAYIALIIEIPLVSLERITYSKIAQGWANKDIEEIKSIYLQSVKYLMLGGGLLLIGIVLNINDLLSMLPEVYQNGTNVAIIACIGGFLNISTGVNNSIIFTSEKYTYGAYLLFLLFILAISLNMLLIPMYGIEGAALATALSSFIYNVLKYFIIWKTYGMQPYDRSSLKIVTVILVVLGACYLIPSHENAIVTMLYKSSIITVLYLVLTYVLNIIPEFHKYIPFIKK